MNNHCPKKNHNNQTITTIRIWSCVCTNFYIVLVGELLYVITLLNLIWTSFAKKN